MHVVELVPVLVLLSAVVFTDIRFHRIPNKLVIALMVLGFIAQGLRSGLPGVLFAAAGVIVGVLLFLPFYLRGAMGAGDAKLMGAVGAVLGPWQVLMAAFATVIFGGVMAMFVLLFSRQCKAFFSRYVRMARTLLATGNFVYLPRTESDPGSKRFAYAAAIASGTVFALYHNHAFDALVLP